MHAASTLGTRAILILFLVAGLLIPRMSAVIADLIPGVRTMIICTGEGLITLTIGQNGEPIEAVEAESYPCVMSEDVIVADAYIPFWQRLASDYAHAFVIRENTRVLDDHLTRLVPTRAPPFVI